MKIAGIDPGQSGAVAVIEDGAVFLYDTPVECVRKGNYAKAKYLPSAMADIFRNENIDHIFIESVGSRPGQGVASMFGFGKGYGLWIGIIAALEIPYTLVTPQAWKKAIMQGISDKDAARGKAMQLYPAKSKELSRKKDIGRADALLIAEYGRRVLK